MNATLLSIFLFTHITAGAIALVSGFIALGLSKRPGRHRVAGKCFFYAMLVVFITAIILSTFKGLDFLFCIAVFSFYMCFKGVRAMRQLKGGSLQIYDYTALLLVSICGSYLIYSGIEMGTLQELSVIHILHMAFGSGILFLAFTTWREFRTLRSGDARWFAVHQASMGGALIATVTAFSTTALSFLPPLVSWLGPTLVLSPLLSYFIGQSKKTKTKTLNPSSYEAI